MGEVVVVWRWKGVFEWRWDLFLLIIWWFYMRVVVLCL